MRSARARRLPDLPLEGLLWIVLAMACAGAAEPPTTPAAEPQYDWGIAYYASYDNGLERAGPIVLQRITEGVKTGRQVAAFQVDYTDTQGMRRYAITTGGVTETRVKSDDSANEDELVAYLTWFTETCRCKRYALVLLDHGGRLDEMCLDERPDTPDQLWMSGRVLGEKLRKFKERMNGRWELLFFQQCGRGALENLYSFRGTAEYLMFSPAKIGAPNSYYTALHQWLATAPEATGDKVAEMIAAQDTDYVIYACLKSSVLDDLPRRLDAALAAFAGKPDLAPVAPLPPPVYTDNGESTRDARILLEQFAAKNAVGAAEVTAFTRWLQENLVVWYQARTAARVRPLCAGVTLFAPANHEEAARYKDLALYKACRLGPFWTTLFPAPRAAAHNR